MNLLKIVLVMALVITIARLFDLHEGAAIGAGLGVLVADAQRTRRKRASQP